MSRFYFHLVDFSFAVIEDEEGSNLPTLAAAKVHALGALQELTAEAVAGGTEAPVESIIIADEHRTHLASLPVVVALPAKMVGLLKAPEKMLPESKFEEYRRNADGCRAKAESATNPDDKMSWLHLANAWLLMLPRSHPAAGDIIGWPKASDEDSQASH